MKKITKKTKKTIPERYASALNQPWVYRGEIVTDSVIDGYESFVYILTSTTTGCKYIGKKGFWTNKVTSVTTNKTTGKKRKTRKKLESNWQHYFGSSQTFIDEEVDKYGSNTIHREILHLCSSKAMASYLEAHEQFKHNCLLEDGFGNGWIMVRVRKEHLKKDRSAIKESCSLV